MDLEKIKRDNPEKVVFMVKYDQQVLSLCGASMTVYIQMKSTQKLIKKCLCFSNNNFTSSTWSDMLETLIALQSEETYDLWHHEYCNDEYVLSGVFTHVE
jgi:hypothetical protein